MKKTAAPKIVLSGWTEIPNTLIRHSLYDHEDFLDRLTHDLVFETADVQEFIGSDKSTCEKVVCFRYDENTKTYSVPRYYLERVADLLEPGVTDLKNMDDTRAGGIPSGKDASDAGYGFNRTRFAMQFRGKLIEDPGKDQAAASQALQDSHGGILVAAPGKGKTIIALHAACAIGRRTLVVVPTAALLDQWLERIQQFTNLHRSEIGVVQGDTCEWRRPIIVGMVQSLSQRAYDDGLYESVGLIISDEVHRIGAPTWLQVIPKFPAMYRWGLSATPKRADGMHRAFQLHMGEVVYEMLELDSQPTVYQVLTGTALSGSEYTNRWNGKPNFSRLFTSLARQNGRNNIIAQEITNCWKAGRKSLVLSKRIAHLASLYHLALQKGVPPEQMGTLAGPEKKKGDRQNILANRKVIFAIEQIAGLGLDQPDLDTLHYALPSQAVEQTMGRIERMLPGKKSPMAFDYVDSVPMLRGLASSRLKKYKKRGYKVVVVNRIGYAQNKTA